MPSMPLHAGRARSVAFAVAALAVLLLVYWPATSGPYLLDDLFNLSLSRPSGWSLGELWRASTANDSGPLGRPVASFTFALNHLWFGVGSTSFKVVNLLIHALSAALVYLLALRLSEHDPSDRSGDFGSRAFALLVAGVWALHPLHVSTVMYVVQRMTLLATLFGVAALLAYVEGRARQVTGRPRARRMLAASVPLCLLSVFSKESGVLVPLYMILAETLIFRFSLDGRRADARLRAVVVGVSSAGALAAVAAYAFLADVLLGSFSSRDFTLAERLMTQAGVVLSYATDFLVPNESAMTFYQDTWPVVHRPDLRFLVPLAALATMLAAVFALRVRMPIVAFGLSLFLASQLLESTVLPLELRFEHRAYLGTIGLALAVASLCRTLTRHGSHERVAAFVLGVALFALGWQTHLRAWTWHDALSLNAHEVDVHPGSTRAHDALAISLFVAGRPREAVERMELAMRIDPEDAYLPLAALQLRDIGGLYDPASFDRALAAVETGTVTLEMSHALNNLVDNHRRGLLNELDDSHLLRLAAAMVERFSPATPPEAKVMVLARQSELLIGQGRHEPALRAIASAVAIPQSGVEARLRMAELQAYMGLVDEARQSLEVLSTGPLPNERAEARVRAVRDRIDAAESASAEE